MDFQFFVQEKFVMKVGDKMYTDKKEAGAALVEMCREMKTAGVSATVGEYAGFKMSVSFDSFNHVFVMNLKGQLSHNLEIGADPLGNLAHINHALESMPKQFSEAQTKLETVERQLETAKTEVTKPFVQEAELAEKLERLTALNALLNMDEKGDDALGLDDEPIPYPIENAGWVPMAGGSRQQGLKAAAAMCDMPGQKMSLKKKLEAFKAQAAGTDREDIGKTKRKEETL